MQLSFLYKLDERTSIKLGLYIILAYGRNSIHFPSHVLLLQVPKYKFIKAVP